ncbi:uncharacterized protein LOC112344340 [Selaginella moellendorffii]|uniref:uncharacterized protein LOC112344340 n=1 Tax=Selaginella moellendorffii TaxID=88036 RepID=UPI000D1C9638|nr:uncharacterized protein LOC112344340 [Selaginella moellendorffii]|eukprot:XP_024524615.1 uncharacterized protein LOC112344340 [Selaginella moellendorffii]
MFSLLFPWSSSIGTGNARYVHRCGCAAESASDVASSCPEDLVARIAGILPNARLKKSLETRKLRRSVGIDYGLERTGIAVTFCGLAPRPLSVSKLKGDNLIKKLLSVAKKEKADEFIVGLPRSWDAQETEQSNKTRTFAGRLAQYSAEEGVRVFLHDEYMTSEDALEFMIYRGSTKKSRRLEVDAYAAVIILQTYFHNDGRFAQLMVPKRGELQEKLCSKYYQRLSQIEEDEDEDEDNEEL